MNVTETPQAHDEKIAATLCSVCFPDAPADWMRGKKLSKAAAAKLVA